MMEVGWKLMKAGFSCGKTLAVYLQNAADLWLTGR